MTSEDIARGAGPGIDIEAVMDLSDIISSLQDLSDDELKLKGMAVEGTLDEMDDPVLLGAPIARQWPAKRTTCWKSQCP